MVFFRKILLPSKLRTLINPSGLNNSVRWPSIQSPLTLDLHSQSKEFIQEHQEVIPAESFLGYRLIEKFPDGSKVVLPVESLMGLCLIGNFLNRGKNRGRRNRIHMVIGCYNRESFDEIFWEHPAKGFYKGNTYSSFDRITHKAWVGAIIRNDKSDMMGALHTPIGIVPTSNQAEAQSVTEIVRFAVKNQFLPLIVEADNEQAVDRAMGSEKQVKTIYKNMQQEVTDSGVVVQHVFEECNLIAHELSHLRLTDREEYMHVDEIHSSIREKIEAMLEYEKERGPYYKLKKD